MSEFSNTYCLDANVLIQAWQKYYSPVLCPDYWKVLDGLGSEGRIFICQEVYDEIVRTEDDLSSWLKGSNIPVRKANESVIGSLKEIYKTPAHLKLVDNTKNRSLADPWVIAHAMDTNSVVVTKYPPDHPILSNFNIPLIFVKTNFDEAKRKNVCPSECLGI